MAKGMATAWGIYPMTKLATAEGFGWGCKSGMGWGDGAGMGNAGRWLDDGDGYGKGNIDSEGFGHGSSCGMGDGNGYGGNRIEGPASPEWGCGSAPGAGDGYGEGGDDSDE